MSTVDTLTEQQLLDAIGNATKIVLLEPPYKRKYIPLGLAKIATYAREHGAEVVFQRHYKPCGEDMICVSTLFTYFAKHVYQSLDEIYFMSPDANVIIGGIFASLMPRTIKDLYPKVNVFVNYSNVLDQCKPAYDIDWMVDEKWADFSYLFTTRGCPNKCGYCAVPRLEPTMHTIPNWEKHIDDNLKYVMVYDNNLSAHPFEHFKSVCEHLSAIGKRVNFDNGFDCKHITPDVAEILAKVKYEASGMRMAFDRIEDDGVFQKAAQLLLDAGVPKGAMFAYVLFNFNDTPQEAIYRGSECIRLGVRPYPQQFAPLNGITRDTAFIGKHWTKHLCKAFRYFHLMGGCWRKNNFMEWIMDHRDEYKLDDEDIRKLNYVKEKK